MLGLLRNNACEFSSARLALLGSLFNQECSCPCQHWTPPGNHKIHTLSRRKCPTTLNTSNRQNQKGTLGEIGAIRSRSHVCVASSKASITLCSLQDSCAVSPHHIPFSFCNPTSGRCHLLIELPPNRPMGVFCKGQNRSLRIWDLKPGTLIQFLCVISLLLSDKEAELKWATYTKIQVLIEAATSRHNQQLCLKASGWSESADLFTRPPSCLALNEASTRGRIEHNATCVVPRELPKPRGSVGPSSGCTGAQTSLLHSAWRAAEGPHCCPLPHSLCHLLLGAGCYHLQPIWINQATHTLILH